MNNLKSKLLGARAEAKVETKPWRVSFVNQSALPDIKVIRTEFLVNYGCGLLAAIAIVLAVKQEVAIWEASAELDKINKSAESMSSADLKIREKASLCDAHLASTAAYVDFRRSGLDVFGLYSALGSLNSDGFVFENLLIDAASPDPKTKKMRGKVVLSGKRKGRSGQDYAKIGQLYEQFCGLDYFKSLKKYKSNPAKPITAADTQDASIGFTFELTLEPL